MNDNFRPVPHGKICAPTAIIFRVYGLRGLDEEHLQMLTQAMEQFFHQAILILFDSITVYCDPPRNPEELPTDTAKIQRFSFFLREKISMGLGFNYELDFSRM